MRIYISGKITGTNDFDYRFSAAERELKKRGYEVVNPVTLVHDHDKTWESYMKECLRALIDCDAIYMLSGWMQSDGAFVERAVAVTLKLKIIYQSYEQRT